MADLSSEALKTEIKTIVAGADLKSLTCRAVRKKLEDKFDVDLSSRKKEIDSLVMAEVEDQANSHSEEEEEEVSEEEAPVAKKKQESDSDAEVEDGDDKDDDDDYEPRKKAGGGGGRKAKPGKKRKSQSDDDSDEEWNKKKPAKKGPAAAGGRGKKASAFTKSFKLSAELADVVGSDVMPRHEVVKKLWAVIKERKLQDPKNKQYAICDEQLLKVFGIKRFRTFGMMKHLKDHFLEAA